MSAEHMDIIEPAGGVDAERLAQVIPLHDVELDQGGAGDAVTPPLTREQAIEAWTEGMDYS